MQDHDPSSSGESQDRSLERFFQILARTEKYIYFTTKWKLLDNSTPDDILDEVAMRVEDNDEYRLAHNIFCGLPKKSRLAYAFHYGGGLSVSEIARLRNTTEDKIESSLKKILHILKTDETHAMMVRFVETELRFADEKCRDMSVALMLKQGIDPAAVYGATQAVDPSVMPAVMDIASHGINQIAQNLNDKIPDVVQTAATGTAAATTAVTNAVTNESFSAFFMVFALPVVWILALIVSGKRLGSAIIETTPSMNMRRWFVKQMFVGYCLAWSGPVAFFVYAAILGFIVAQPDEHALTFSFYLFFGALVVSCVLYPIYLYSGYRSIKALEEMNEMLEFSQLERFIRKGIYVLSLILFFCFLLVAGKHFIVDVLHFFRSERYPQGIIAVCIIVFFAAATYSVHQGMNQFFRYYLTLCHSKTSVRSKPSKMDSFLGSIQGELNYIPFFFATVLCATFTLGANLIHIFGTKTHSWGSLMELVFFFPWWCLIIWQNIKQPKNRWYWLAGSFAIQVGIMAYLRSVVY